MYYLAHFINFRYYYLFIHYYFIKIIMTNFIIKQVHFILLLSLSFKFIPNQYFHIKL